MTTRLDRGSAPVEFVLVSGLLIGLSLAVLQVAFVAHVRAVAVDSVIAGAAHAALADTTDDEGLERARLLVGLGVAADLVRDVSLRSETIDGKPLVTITADLAVPLVGPWIPLATVQVAGRAFREGA